MADPRVSVVLPVHNGERFIAPAVRSVLAQSFEDFELLIINDGSTDATAERVGQFSDPRIGVITNGTNAGIQKSLNLGLRRARGEYIARIDDDDAWIDPYKLKKQVDYLERHPDCALLGTGAIVVDESGRELHRFLNPADDRSIRKTLLGRNCFVHSSVLFRKSEALKHGGYDEGQELRHVEDYALWLAIGRDRKLANLPEYAVKYLVRGSGLSGRHRIAQFRNNLHLVRKCGAGYPRRSLAILRSWLRLLLYGYLNLSGLKSITARFK
jgi:glycosyltransferase involved in cell wall biosynthesis